MSNQLQTNLETILNEKTTKILPENIKKGVTIFDVEGTAETGGSKINNQDKEITTNGTYTADEGYTGLGTVTVNVPQGENLQEQLDAQDLIIQQLQEELAGKSSGGEVKPNVFMQEDEPTTKDGIWLKGNYQVDNIVADENIFAGEEWNTTKMSSLKVIPYDFYCGSAVAIGTDVYLFGSYDKSYYTRAYKYDTLTDTYTKLADIPYNFYYGSATFVGTNIYLFGGAYDHDNVYKYDTLTNTYGRLANPPYSYSFMYGSAISIGTNVYLFGSPSEQTTAYKYDTLAKTYTKLTDIPYNFYSGSAVAIGTDIYLFGSAASKTTAYKYDTLTGTYTKLTDTPYNFSYGSVVAIGTNVYLFGGSDSKTTAYKYDTLTDTYTKLADIPYEFSSSSAVFNGTDVYLFGGSGNKTKVQVMTMIPNDYGNNSIVISQGVCTKKTDIGNIGIQNAKFYYDRVYYQDENGKLLNTIPTYNGNGTEWVKISGGEG